MDLYKCQLDGSRGILSLVPQVQGQEVQAYPPAGSHTLRCQWSPWRRWQWCRHAHSGPGVAGLPAPQCSSPGPGGGHSAAWQSSFPTCTQSNSFFPDSSERLVEPGAGGTRPPIMGQGQGQGPGGKPRPGLPPCSCLCPSMRCPLPSPVIHLGQLDICPSRPPTPMPIPPLGHVLYWLPTPS